MEIINPITAERCNAYIGKPVCAILHDGSRVYGYLRSIEGERLILAEQAETVGTSEKNKKGKKAKAQGFTPFSPFGFFPGGTLALEFALIALLFAVPFFW